MRNSHWYSTLFSQLPLSSLFTDPSPANTPSAPFPLRCSHGEAHGGCQGPSTTTCQWMPRLWQRWRPAHWPSPQHPHPKRPPSQHNTSAVERIHSLMLYTPQHTAQSHTREHTPQYHTLDNTVTPLPHNTTPTQYQVVALDRAHSIPESAPGPLWPSASAASPLGTAAPADAAERSGTSALPRPARPAPPRPCAAACADCLRKPWPCRTPTVPLPAPP